MDPYLVTKTLHIFCVLLWIGGVLANSVVLLVARNAPQSIDQAFLRIFYKLDRWTINPAQGFAWLFGVGLIFMGGWFPDIWLIAKLICVSFISALHGIQSAVLRKLTGGKDAQTRLTLACRFSIAALPILFVIVALVVNKPF